MVVTRRVLVTRPQPGADETAERLVAMGFEPVVMPLTQIVPLEVNVDIEPTAYDAVAITSVNAVRHAPPELLAALRHKPVFAVGDASALAAREAGFDDVRSAAGTARELAALILRECKAGTRLIHPVGRERTAGFAETLSAGNILLTPVEVYGADEISYPSSALEDTAAGGPLWGALALSPRAGKILSGFAGRPELGNLFASTRFFCISHNAARPLDRIARERIFVSEQPTEESVILMLGAVAA